MKGYALVGAKTSNDNNKNNNITTTTSNVCISSPTTIFLQSSVCHIGGYKFQNSCINPNILKS
jgi:hypothetical protein